MWPGEEFSRLAERRSALQQRREFYRKKIRRRLLKLTRDRRFVWEIDSSAEIKRSRTVNLRLHLGSRCDGRHLDRIEVNSLPSPRAGLNKARFRAGGKMEPSTSFVCARPRTAHQERTHAQFPPGCRESTGCTSNGWIEDKLEKYDRCNF